MDRSNIQPTQRYSSPNVGPDQMRNHMRDSLHPVSQFQSNSTVGDKPNSPRPRPQDERPRGEPGPSMPPPSAPSQKASAQELRETAKQTISRTDKPDDKLSRIITEVRAQNGSAAPSPRVRSPSPTSRPGTRNHSNDSRASGGRPRSDRGNVDSGAEDRRIEKDRIDSREHGPAPLGRRDSISHPRPRSGRDRQSAREEKDDKKDDRDRDRDRDRRDRHGDRDRDKDRDRERDRERERERDRERDKDRDRHRRDEKDRDRESRKDRETGRGAIQSTSMPQDDRGLPTRPDPSRHRSGPGSEDSLGKRRRGTDDEVNSSISPFILLAQIHYLLLSRNEALSGAPARRDIEMIEIAGQVTKISMTEVVILIDTKTETPTKTVVALLFPKRCVSPFPIRPPTHEMPNQLSY